MKCPVCRKFLSTMNTDTANRNSEDHLIACGCIVDLDSHGSNNQFYNCACGAAFIDGGSRLSIAGDFARHAKKAKHDWKSLLTIKALESF